VPLSSIHILIIILLTRSLDHKYSKLQVLPLYSQFIEYLQVITNYSEY